MNSSNNRKLSITVIMPALNEEKNIQAAIDDTLAALTHYNIDGEIIVINDGSTDNTPSLINTRIQQDQRVKLINHEQTKGIGASFLEGIKHAQGDIVTMFPGDNENEPLEGLRYLMLLEHVDIVVPFVYNREIRSLFRNVVSFMYNLIINITFKTDFNYTNGTVFYRRSVLAEFTFNNTGFFYQTEILLKAVKRGYMFAEVPYYLRKRSIGKSNAFSFSSFFNVVKGYLQLIWDIYFSKNGTQKNIPLCDDSVSSQRFKGYKSL